MTSTLDQQREELAELLSVYDLDGPTSAIAEDVLAAGFRKVDEETVELEGTTFADDIDARRDEYRRALVGVLADFLKYGTGDDEVFLPLADKLVEAVRAVAAAGLPDEVPYVDELDPELEQTRTDPIEHIPGEPVADDLYKRLDQAVRDYHEEIGTGGVVESWVVALDIVEHDSHGSRTGAIGEKYATRAHAVGMLSEAVVAVRLSGLEAS